MQPVLEISFRLSLDFLCTAKRGKVLVQHPLCAKSAKEEMGKRKRKRAIALGVAWRWCRLRGDGVVSERVSDGGSALDCNPDSESIISLSSLSLSSNTW
jgi:hypothetical protein